MLGRQTTLLVSLLLIAGSVPLVASANEGESTFTWNAPETLEGTFAINLRATFEGPAVCTIYAAASGIVDEENPFDFFVIVDRGGISEWMVRTHARDTSTRVHALDVVDTADDDTSADGQWRTFVEMPDRAISDDGAAGDAGIWGDGTLEVTVVGTSFADWENPFTETPLEVELTCDREPQLVKRAGTDVVPFDQFTLDGGVGAATGQGGGASALVGDGLAASFGTEDVLFKLRTHQPRGAQMDLVTLEHPDGQEAFAASRVLEPDFTGSGGAYELTVTRASADLAADPYVGLLAGLDQVASLDDATP